jgi:heat shock protein HslJ
MACPDAPMALENGFLNELGHVTAYAFQDGRLALSWHDGSRSGVLLFRK